MQTDPRVIQVTGRGVLRLTPDTTRLTITLRGTCPEYEQAIAASARDTQGRKELIAGLGFARDSLRTLSFDVTTEDESIRDPNGDYRQQLVGYQFTHATRLEFPRDNGLLGRLLYALGHGEAAPELVISYTVRDREGAKNRLLGQAVADARAKAEVLARAAGVPLSELLRIDYTRGEPDLEVRPMARPLRAMASAAPGYHIDIQPDDIEVSDTVTVVWAMG